MSEEKKAEIERSPIAEAVSRLKDASFDAAKRREKLPQPLFWSLFNIQISEIRRKKEIQRAFSDIFDSQE